MSVVAWVFALLTAAVNVAVFVAEAFFITRPAVHAGVFAVPTGDVPAVRLWAFGVGFYNLIWACGLVGGVALWVAGSESVGRALVAYVCLALVLSGVVLLVADRLALSRPRGTGVTGAVGQAVPPLVALLATVAA